MQKYRLFCFQYVVIILTVDGVLEYPRLSSYTPRSRFLEYPRLSSYTPGSRDVFICLLSTELSSESENSLLAFINSIALLDMAQYCVVLLEHIHSTFATRVYYL